MSRKEHLKAITLDENSPLNIKLQVFVSSVQKELEDERLIVQNLLNTDAFLSVHCTPELYEFEPASPDRAAEGCLKTLDGCQVYLLIIGTQYGTRMGELSITHTEYRRSKERKLPILAFIKGDRKTPREEGEARLIEELEADGLKYKRFGNVIELQKEVRASLVKLLKEDFGIAPSSDEDNIAKQTIEATSPFEARPLDRIRWQDLDHGVARRLVSIAENCVPEDLREALVNAVAHRQHEDAGRKIILEVFPDRVVVSSPGLPPAPITLASLRKGKYRPCSRNPVLAQCLSYFHRIEERGSGFRRMRDQMLNHGLDQPLIGTDTGYFQVTFPGPGENIERIRVPESQLTVSPALEASLNQRQKEMVKLLLEGKELTSRECETRFGVTRPVVSRELGNLVELGLAVRVGAGRSTRYRLKSETLFVKQS